MKKKDLRTLQRFLEVECWKLPAIRSLDRTLLAVSDACKQINRIVQRAQTDDLYGAAIDPATGQVAELNVQGECQQQLDVLCNTLMLRALCGAANNAVCAVASEEEPLPRSCADVMGYHVGSSTTTINVDGGGGGAGNYVAVFDPIDGSKNIDASLPVGTIFGIYRCPEGGVTAVVAEGEEGSRGRGWNIESFLQRGTKLVAAGYCLYSATTVLCGFSATRFVDYDIRNPCEGNTLCDVADKSCGIKSIHPRLARAFDDFAEEPGFMLLPVLCRTATEGGRADECSGFHSINFVMRADVDKQQGFHAGLRVFLFREHNPAVVGNGASVQPSKLAAQVMGF